MRPEDKIQEPLTVEVLQAYLHGRLSPNQQDQVRLLIANNLLYQDALEGLKYVDDDYPLQESLSEINETIRSENEEKVEIGWLRPLAVAASLIVVIGAAYIIYVVTSPPDSETIYAENYEKYPVTAKSAKDYPASSLSFDSLKPGQPVEEEPAAAVQQLPPPEIPVVETEEANVYEEVDLVEDEIMEPEAVPPSPPAAPDVQKETLSRAGQANDESALKLNQTKSINKSSQSGAGNVSPSVEAEPARMEVSPSLANAKVLYESSEYEKALTLFNDLLEQHPNHAEALLYSSLCLMELDRHNEALDRLEQLLKQPGSEFTEPAAWYRALSLVKLDKIKKAKNALRSIQEDGGTYAEEARKLLEQL